MLRFHRCWWCFPNVCFQLTSAALSPTSAHAADTFLANLLTTKVFLTIFALSSSCCGLPIQPQSPILWIEHLVDDDDAPRPSHYSEASMDEADKKRAKYRDRLLKGLRPITGKALDAPPQSDPSGPT